jgi:hypothetical protein
VKTKKSNQECVNNSNILLNKKQCRQENNGQLLAMTKIYTIGSGANTTTIGIYIGE